MTQRKSHSSISRAIAISTLLIIILTGCAHSHQISTPIPADSPQRGDVISVEKIGGYSAFVARAIVWIAGMSDEISTRYGFDMYRLSYLTLSETGDIVEATGLVSLPRNEEAIAVLSWHHGTSVTRNQVPSTPTPDEGILASIAYAGHGYVLLAPDYVGLGGSSLSHPYYHAATAVANIRDLITAAQSVVQDSSLAWPEQLFLTGFSQGGYNTIASLRDLEENPIPGMELTAAASIAGPFDLADFSFPNALKGEAESASMYLAYLINSFARIYGEPLASVFAEPYDTTVPEIFSGELQGDEVIAALPSDPRLLFNEATLAGFDRNDLGWIGTRLKENSLKEFVPATPIRLYYGNLDADVSPTEALSQVQRWQQEGLQVIAEDVGPFDHNESVVEAAPRIRDWFDQLLIQ